MTRPNPQRVGLFGGTFDPVHLGHLLAAQEAVDRLDLARVILMPAYDRPHKDREVTTPAADRLAMLRLAAADDPRLEVSDLEIRRGGMSYTIDTVLELRTRINDLVLLMGSDSVRELATWHRVGELVDLCTVVVMARPGFAMASLDALRPALTDAQIARLAEQCLPIPLIEISSTDIRARLAAGRPIRYLVPHAVEDYIAEHGLYRA